MATVRAPSLENRVGVLEQQMTEVLAKPAFRKKTEKGVCVLGFEPSEKCPDGSLGRMQGGCHGYACLKKGSDYYKDYRARKKAEGAPVVRSTKVANPTPVKKSIKRAAPDAPAKRPIKRAVKPAAKRTIKRRSE
jgi:hypothetical protein